MRSLDIFVWVCMRGRLIALGAVDLGILTIHSGGVVCDSAVF
jgi:hypothetical protein